LQLSEDGKELIITNRKPIENLKYILEADPDHLREERERMRNKPETVHTERIATEYLPTELD
jgi:hypothetical protein